MASQRYDNMAATHPDLSLASHNEVEPANKKYDENHSALYVVAPAAGGLHYLLSNPVASHEAVHMYHDMAAGSRCSQLADSSLGMIE
jgi:hypothetical protein